LPKAPPFQFASRGTADTPEAKIPQSCRLAVCYANSSAHTGAGHMMRLFAIAQTLTHRGYRVVFLSKFCATNISKKLIKEGFAIEYCKGQNFALDPLVVESAPDVLIIDDYHISADEWQSLKTRRLNRDAYQLVVLDDALDDFALAADIVVNASPTANVGDYKKRNTDAVLCLGIQYTPLRQEFRVARYHAFESRQHLLITLGGTDVKNMSFDLAHRLLRALPNASICVLLGAVSDDQLAKYKVLSAQYSNLDIKHNLDNVAELMSGSRLAISAAGGTLSELACMGVPTIALVSVDNQIAALKSEYNGISYVAIDVRCFELDGSADKTVQDPYLFEIIGKAVQLWHKSCSLESMSQSARQLIDARGCERIVDVIDASVESRGIN